MKNDYELRYTHSTYGIDTEFEARSQNDTLTIVGYAAVFNSRSHDLGGFKEVIEPGTFRNAVNDPEVCALWNHNSDMVLGRRGNGSLRMTEDSKGLLYEVDLIDSPDNRFRYEQIARGDVRQSSFGFAKVKDSWDTKNRLRTLQDVRLFDVSPVAFPAYPAATIGTRALELWADEEEKELAEVRALLDSVENEERTSSVETYVASRFEPSRLIQIRARYSK